MTEVLGIGVSKGIATGNAYVLSKQELESSEYTVEDVEAELARFHEAVESSDRQLQALAKQFGEKSSEDAKDVLEIQQMYLQDDEFRGAIDSYIQSKKVNAETAVKAITEKNRQEFECVEEEYFKQRIADIQDLSARLLRNLMGVAEADLSDFPKSSILVSNDLTPSDTLAMNFTNVVGICLASRLRTSHTAIIARNMGIPAVFGIDVGMVRPKMPMIIDGENGKVILDPEDSVREKYKKRIQLEHIQKQENSKRSSLPAKTKDGKIISVLANIGNVKDAEVALAAGADGVGLFRTEFLYLQKNAPPDEEEQYQVYRSVANLFNGKPVTIRTLDIGGDKQTEAIKLPREDNPFLGLRAIRLCLKQRDIFRVQLRALLRAAENRDIRVMVPMVGTIAEIDMVYNAVQEAKESLKKDELPFAKDIKIGMMIEVPSAAILAEKFAERVSFFSIGTNDLSQYVMASDRTNENVAGMADPFDPAVLRLIQWTLKAGRKSGLNVAMCGEMAGDRMAVPLLLGMGLSEFSMSPASIAEIKEHIRFQSVDDCVKVADRCLAEGSIKEVKRILA